jgi:hypothetical protein
MVKLFSAAALLLAMTFASTASADPLQVTVIYDAKAQEKIEKTYGVREKAVIQDMVERSLRESLKDRVARVEVVIHDLTANRPTFKELGDTPGLSMQSFGIGGAEIRGEQINADGGRVKLGYSWYESDIRWAQAQGTWGDAEQAIHGFARRVAEGHADIPTK